MLGVLAIIGVLSVGGIAGYSKAMMKYRINKTIEQITLIAGNIRSFFGSQKNYEGLDTGSNEGRKTIKKAKLFPEEMWNESTNQYEHVFGNYIAAYKNYYNNKMFEIYLSEIPPEACIELTTQDWSAMNAKEMGISSYRSCIHGNLAVPLDMESAVSYCSECAAKEDNSTNRTDLIIYFE